MQGMQVQPLVWEDSTCPGATKPIRHNSWSPSALEPVLHNEKLPQQEKVHAEQRRPNTAKEQKLIKKSLKMVWLLLIL